MEATPAVPGRPHGRALVVASTYLLLALCLWPYAGHLKEASLLGDDAQRVEDLQVRPLSALWFRPFNEHMAPAFETVSWITWRCAGRRLTGAPWAFTVASYVPFVLCLVLLKALVRRELGSPTAAAVAVALFALTPAYTEVVFWYSASSFSWALAFTLAALYCAGRARDGRPEWSWAGAATAALAPACSAIGLIAGPAAALVAWPRKGAGWRSWVATLAPVLGSMLYLGLACANRYHAVVTASVGRFGDVVGLAWAARAPLYLLATGPLGLRHAERFPIALGLAAFGAGVVACLAWALHGGPRRVIAAGLMLIAGGYALTYCFRTFMVPGEELLLVGRYHLFPQAGLALLLAAVGRRWLARLDRRPAAGFAVALGVTIGLATLNRGEIRVHALWHRYPEQAATLAGLERLAEVCRQRGITRDQVLAALDPVLTRWNNPGRNTLGMLPLTTSTPRVPQEAVRATIVAALAPAERGQVFGGMDASTYLMPNSVASAPGSVSSPGRLAAMHRVRTAGATGQYLVTGRRAYLEYQFPPQAITPRALRLPHLGPGQAIQIWWTNSADRWSATRSLGLSTDPSRPGHQDWVLPFEPLPHWGPGDGRRVRIVFSNTGRVAVGTPALLRRRQEAQEPRQTGVRGPDGAGPIRAASSEAG
jgi:hypothetical protein